MRYVQVDSEGRIIAHTVAVSNPDPEFWVEFELPQERLDDFNDYLLVDGELIYDPIPHPPAPVTTEQVLAAIVEAQQDTLVPLLPDSVIEGMESYFPEWEAGHAYQVGNMLTYGYVIYKCIQAHTSQADWTPDVAVSLFARVLTSDEPQPWVQPDSTNPYMQGDRVTHNGHTWVSDIDNNVWEPGVYGWTIDD